MALEGDRPIGQTSVQFMIVRQRNSRKGSLFKSSRRSPVARSRLSLMKRYAWISPAGPTNLSGFHHDEGHWLVQQPLLFGRRFVVDEIRLDRVVLFPEPGHVDHQVADDREARQWSQHDRFPQPTNPGYARQSVAAVDVDRVGAAYALVAGFSDGERVILGIPDAKNDIEQHPIGQDEIDMEILHVRLVVSLRVVAENREMHGGLMA